MFPTTEQGLLALRDKPEGVENWQGPYLQKEIENDPWGHPYVYHFPGDTEMSPTSSATAPTASPAETGSMPTSSVGKTSPGAALLPRSHVSNERVGNAGVTLIEMMVVVALISLMVGISFPAITSGIDSLRLNAATNSVVSFLDSGLSRAERRQQVVEITISKADNSIEMRSSEPGSTRKLKCPKESPSSVLPRCPRTPMLPRTFSALSRRHRAAASACS